MARVVRLALVGLAFLLLLWVATVVFVILAGERPELRRADAILVLGAAQYNGRPSPVLKARLDHAIDLYHEGYAEHLVVTGGVGVGDTLSEGEVARQYAIENGIRDEVVLVDRHGVTSGESIRAAAALMQARDLRSALLVSDPFHMLRLQLLARRAGILPFRAPTPASPITRSPEVRWRYILRESLVFPYAAVVGNR